jgi:uncharacterized protein (DUF1501 family)
MNAHRACDDFHRTADLQSRLTRRQLIGRGAAAGLAVYAAKAMPLGRMLEAAYAQGAAAPDAPLLVAVFLPGGVDLLDTLVPTENYGRYADLRPRIRVEGAERLPGVDFGMHPALSRGTNGGVRGLFEQGRIGVLPGIDYPNYDLSHFHSRHFWETGLITHKASSGWLGRWLDQHGSRDNPLQGLSLSFGLSPVMRSAGAPVAALSSVRDSDFWIPDVWGVGFERAMDAWGEMSSRSGSTSGETAALGAAKMAKDVADRLAPYRHDSDEPNPLAGPVEYPRNNRFAERLRTLAGLLSTPLGIRVVTVDAQGDFDTHDNQKTELETSLGRVSEGLAAFQADLEARGIADRVLTFVWSEFGRRLAQNESDGTDHGAGGLAWVQGTRAATGVLSDYPSKTDRQGNLDVTIDFRRVYSSLLEQWLGTEAAAVIPRADSFGRVGLVR